MKKLILSAAISALALTVAACGDNDADDAADTTVVDTADTTGTDAAAGGAGAAGTTTAGADWPRGTRIVEEGGTTYRVNPDNTRVAIDDGSWRVVTEGGERFRVDASGTRHRIDDDGLDVDLPAVEGVDVDLGTNKKGNLDLDVSTDGGDASNDRGGDR